MVESRVEIAEWLKNLQAKLRLSISDEKLFEEILKERRHQEILGIIEPLITNINKYGVTLEGYVDV